MKSDCVYLDPSRDSSSPRCVYRHADISEKDCRRCRTKLLGDDKDFGKRWRDPLLILDRKRNETDSIYNLLAGGSAFLIGGGPSANEIPLELLSTRGIFSLAVNNSSAHPRIRPQVMVCSDPPKKFSHSVWLDPGIMKIIPIPKLGGRRAALRRKLPDGKFVPLDQATTDCPNVWGFQRNSWMFPDERFFLTDGACWGNHKVGVELTGELKTVSTMLLGLRILAYLGARTIYLVGVDFAMAPERGYSFGQGRDAGASRSNNSAYNTVNEWLCRMADKGIFEKFGLTIYNTYEMSGLRAFPYVPYEEAISRARGMVEVVPNLEGWYEKEK